MIHHFYEWLIRPYHDYETYMIYLEMVAASTGIISVYLCYKRNILTYAFGAFSAFLYVYLLYKWELFGDMFLNSYFLIVNLLGLFVWSRHLESDSHIKVYVTKANFKQKRRALYIFIATLIITPFIYALQKQVTVIELPGYTYIDAFVTGISFAALYLELGRNIENWYLWAIADIVAIPLFIYKGYGITAIQYGVFLTIVYFGWRKWREQFVIDDEILA